MPSIPATQLLNIETKLVGTVASAGSTAKAMNLICHYRRTTNVNAVDKGHIGVAWLAAVRAAFTACVSLRLTLAGLDVRFLNDALDAYQRTADTHAGVITGDSMPLTQAVYLKMTTGLRGRSYRGSHHIFPIGESATTVLTDDILNAAALTYFGTLATALLASFTDSDGNVWVPQILSKKLSQLKSNPTTVVANDVTAIAVAKRIGTMRHRRVAQLY